MDFILYFFVFLFGLSVGSFLNVFSYRFPQDLSLIKPDSFCPRCQTPIKWYDNIPLLSYFILRGKCRHCCSSISLEYPAIELLTAILTLLFFYKWHTNIWWMIFSLISVYLLIVVSVIDFKTMMISDFFSYLLAFLGVIASQFNPNFEGVWHQKLLSSFYGIICGAGFIWILSYMGKLIYKKDAVGEGDMFLLGAMGSWLGCNGVFSTVIIASFVGSFYGISLVLFKKVDKVSYMPFGPFLAIGCIYNLYSFWNFIEFILS